MRFQKLCVLPLAALSISIASAQVSVDLGTAGRASSFLITGAGATAAPAIQSGSDITITSNTISTGTFVTGGSLGSFNGFWYADETFFLPAGATSVSLTVSNLTVDDRVVVQLNGVNIANTGLFAPGVGLMRFLPGTTDVSFTFTTAPGPQSGVTTTGFILGGTNTVRLIVNNTGNGIPVPTTVITPIDATRVTLAATLTYNLAVTPVPPSLLLLFTGLLVLAAYQWRRRSQDISLR